MRRIWLALFLVLSLVLAACNGGDTDDTATPAPDDTPVDDAADDDDVAEDDDGDEVADADDDADDDTTEEWDAGVDRIRIGLINPYSGPFGFFGTFVENSVRVEVDRINAAGGLGGAEIEIVTRDMELNPQLAVQAAGEFSTDDSVSMVVGPPFTGFFNAAKGTFEDNQQVNCAMAVAGAEALDGLTYAFRTQDPDQFRMPVLLDWLAENRGIESIAIVYEDDDTGRGYDEFYSEYGPEQGVEYVGFQATRPDDQTHRPQVQAVAEADAIIVSSNSTNAAKTAVAAEEIGYEGLLVGFSGLQGFTYVEGAGDAADGTVFISNYIHYFTDIPAEEWLPGYREHVEAVIEQYGETEGPSSGVRQFNGTALAADCVYFFGQAVNAAQSLEPDDIVAGWEGLDIPEDETPSGVRAQFGPDDREAYGPEDLYMYEWTRDGDEWRLEVLYSPREDG
jgi:ABC-type branched-subunit amino acid transport system substrate-binding protein